MSYYFKRIREGVCATTIKLENNFAILNFAISILIAGSIAPTGIIEPQGIRIMHTCNIQSLEKSIATGSTCLEPT